ncbi:MAG TPA: peptidylprolyl isomerase [Vicinamibacterales bacterium]|nr:peptidylprolyl isomerase [Vicinamibacterales bacterium]
MRIVLVILIATLGLGATQRPTSKPVPPRAPVVAPPFQNPYAPEELRNKQAVIETAAGTIVLDLLDERAPMHVAHFIKTARDGNYDGTTFHRVIRHGIIQGGDPLSKDLTAGDRYGTGGLNRLTPELNSEKHTRGAVSAVLVPNRPDSAGTQFFICVADQPALDGQYTIFARVAEGIAVAQKLSEAAANDKGAPIERLVMTKVTIREKPAPVPEPFATDPVSALSQYRAVLETSLGEVTIEFTPDKAPEHVRNFLRLAGAGVYDGTTFHRVVKGFVVQTGHMPTRREPLAEHQQKFVRDLKAEFNDQPHDLGTVSMARLADPDTANTSFFIVTARAQMLDNKYTVFGRVVSGLDVVQKIEAAAVNGESPVDRIELRRVRVERR